MMRIRFPRHLATAAFIAVAAPVIAQSPALPQSTLAKLVAPPAQSDQATKPKPEETEVWEPVPKVVTPGNCGAPPSDAVVLFDGKNMDQWVTVSDKSPAKWTVEGGVMTVNKSGGSIETRQSFKNYQLHVEWKVPTNITGSGQARGNSGVFLASTGPGDDGYELQVLDSYENKTYVNGMAGSIYKQSIPLANPTRKPGEWQTYDIVWTAPTFESDGSLEDSGLRHGPVQWRAGAKPFRVEGADALHRQAVLQGLYQCSHQAPGAWRQERAHQLQKYLGA